LFIIGVIAFPSWSLAVIDRSTRTHFPLICSGNWPELRQRRDLFAVIVKGRFVMKKAAQGARPFCQIESFDQGAAV
jgi:hypothetical protein